VADDYFFSGHTAIAAVAALQLVHAAPPWLAAVGVVIAAVEATTVIVLRAHYTMDVFTAILAAWAADELATRIAPSCDALLRSLG
jgi:membrane-associated phospholipid phosphatase